jgi:tetratricopeptide (TPR) repeat protein
MVRYRAELAAIAIAFALAAPAAALADPRPMVEEAHREFERGQDQFAEGDYAGAIASYEVGFAIDPHPDFLYARGQALRLSGDCAGAIEAYHGFLASSPPDTEAKVTRFNIARCERELAAARRQADLRDEPWYRDALGGVLAGGAVIALATGTAYLIVADQHVDKANDAYGLEEYYYEADLAHTDRKIGVVLGVAGGALAIAAVLRYSLRERDKITVTAMPTSGGGAAVVLGGRF